MRLLKCLLLSAVLPILCAALAQGAAAQTATGGATTLPEREIVVATKLAPPFAMKRADGQWE